VTSTGSSNKKLIEYPLYFALGIDSFWFYHTNEMEKLLKDAAERFVHHYMRRFRLERRDVDEYVAELERCLHVHAKKMDVDNLSMPQFDEYLYWPSYEERHTVISLVQEKLKFYVQETPMKLGDRLMTLMTPGESASPLTRKRAEWMSKELDQLRIVVEELRSELHRAASTLDDAHLHLDNVTNLAHRMQPHLKKRIRPAAPSEHQ